MNKIYSKLRFKRDFNATLARFKHAMEESGKIDISNFNATLARFKRFSLHLSHKTNASISMLP